MTTEQVFRDSEYLKWIRGQNCAVMDFGSGSFSCGFCFDRRRNEAAHIRARQRFGALHVVPLCPKHHQEQHDTGIVTWATKYFVSREKVEKLAEAYLEKWRGNFTALEDLK